MKQIITILITAALVLAVGCAPQEVTIREGEPAQGSITVTGKAGIDVTPDMAVVLVGVTSEGNTSEQARQSNTEAINATIEALRALGIAEEDIQTANLSMWPRYGDSGNITGYRMSVDLSVTVRDIDLAGQVVDTAIGSGSNSLGSISFMVSNEDEVYDKALQEAVKLARTKAEGLAAAAGKTAGEARDITETSRTSVTRVNPSTGGGKSMEAAADTALMAGTTTITAEVSATFTVE